MNSSLKAARSYARRTVILCLSVLAASLRLAAQSDGHGASPVQQLVAEANEFAYSRRLHEVGSVANS